MKKLVMSVFATAIVGMFVTSASAMNPVSVHDVVSQDTVKKDTVKKEVLLVQNEVTYTKIETADVPEVVKTAVAAKYEGYAIEEASKGNDNSYKLVLKKDDAKKTLVYNEAGELVKEETAGEGVVLV